MRQLRSEYVDDPRVTALATAARDGQECVLGAVHGGLAPLLIAATTSHFAAGTGPRLVVCNDPDALQDDLEELGIAAAVLPQVDEYDRPDEDEADDIGLSRRIAAMQAYLRGRMLLATPHSCDQGVPRRESLAAASIGIRVGEEVAMHDLTDRLVDAGYHVAAVCEDPGEISVRGGIVDVFPVAAELPLRIEFFGDEIDTIRRFDPDTQESVARIEEAQLTAGSGMILDTSLWEVCDDDPVWVLGDLPLRGRTKRAPGRAELRLARQLPSDALDGASVGVERFKGDLLHDLAELEQAAGESAVLLFARNEEAQHELRTHCQEHGLELPIRIGRLGAGFRDMERGLLVVHDFELAHRRPARRRRKGPLAGAPLSSLSDLKHNDYVVHVNHGIARFKGMAALEKRGYIEDYLLLEFAEESRIYVPVTAIDLIQKYVGGAGRHPTLTKLGGAAWRRRKEKARQAIEDISAQLLETQARRAREPGLAFPTDPAAQRRFDASFPYEETQDQLQATREIRADMEAARPMDRLLCGDVGFGKTEIAMRAAFRAAHAGYQVAVLAPTTILAEQHARTFTERFAETDHRVGCINRFRSPAERRELLDATRHGEITILIGTHALLTEQLSFANLGMLIIDEEQRFGVKHKEMLKAVRHGVDVLTLTATPIPRTLHLSLLGVRDISVLAEAPAERMAIQTRVAHWDKGLIRSALERELDRGGQVFVVHNRVKDIDRIGFKLARILPEMRLEIIHGQMPELRISRAMRAFQHGAIDCLLATSIVESGLDIPNANTLLVNNAHCFGLAELHQLRGRIGRFTRQAYAYFLTPDGHRLGEDARERLAAIQEYAELGAGFKLAMRDLEIRGTGNLLGAEQSGHIDAIGYELYCRLLNDAIRRQGYEPEPGAAAALGTGSKAALILKLDAYIPDDYIENPTLKFELHKGLDACRRLTDLRDLARNARDRYGPPPLPLQRLFGSRAVRIRCEQWGIHRVEARERQVYLHVADTFPAALMQSALPELLHVQSDDGVVILFIRTPVDGDAGLGFLLRLFDIETDWALDAAPAVPVADAE